MGPAPLMMAAGLRSRIGSQRLIRIQKSLLSKTKNRNSLLLLRLNPRHLTSLRRNRCSNVRQLWKPRMAWRELRSFLSWLGASLRRTRRPNAVVGVLVSFLGHPLPTPVQARRRRRRPRHGRWLPAAFSRRNQGLQPPRLLLAKRWIWKSLLLR